MPESKMKVMHNGSLVDGVDVPIIQANELWSEYHLEDGTKLRVKYVLASIARIDGQFDQDQNPVYALKGNVVAVPTVPENLRRKD